MRRKNFVLLGVLFLSLMGVRKLEDKLYEEKIIFETDLEPVRMNKRMNYKNVLSEMDAEKYYSLELSYASYTKDDFINEYGYYDVKEFREASKSYHTNKNNEIIKKLGVQENVLDVSSYTPYVYLNIDSNHSEHIYNEAYSLAKNSNISKVFISQERVAKTMDLDNSTSTLSTTDTPTPRVAYDNYPVNCSSTGSGIKIGLLEPSSLDTTDTRLSSIHAEVILDNTSSNNGDHALSVALVLGAQYGIAPAASIYFADADSRSNLLALEDLIDAGCDVINMSFGLYTLLDATIYDASTEGYLDYMYHSTRIIMVASAGNGLDIKSQEGKVSLPAAAANVIAVGAYDTSNYICCYSSCNTLDKIYSKPELVAVGGGRNVPGYGGVEGTSYSAPAVTGTIALMLEEVPTLDTQQILALLVATANPDLNCRESIDRVKSSTNLDYADTITVPNTYDASTGLYKRSGAGKLDIAAALDQLYYFDPYYNSPLPDKFISEADLYTLGTLNLTQGDTLKISVAIERWATTYWLFGTKYRSEDMATFAISIFDPSNTCIAVLSNQNYIFANVKTLTIDVETTGTYTFYLQVFSISYSTMHRVHFRTI